MKLFIIALCLVSAACSLHPQSLRTNGWPPPPEYTQVPLWPGEVPDAQAVPGPESTTVQTEHLVAGQPWVKVTNVSQPTLTVYPPKGKNTGVAVVVFPGGGYQNLAIDLEGTEICAWLNSNGITGVLLKYRVPIKWVGRYAESPQALQDVQRALGLVRLHAHEWHIDPHKLGVIGFSAGGHLVTAVSTHYDRRLYPPVDVADQESCRPDFALALYPGHLWAKGDDQLRLNPNVPVTADTPPTFIVQATDDPVDNVNNALVYYLALRAAQVPVELHLYAQGSHGYGLRRTELPITEWPELAQRWLGTIGMIPR